jgi:uncharacterized protein YndB with AHSA1/START domain
MKDVQMPYDFQLTTIIPASPQEIYDAWLDNVAHSEMTGAEALMSDELDAEISAWDGYISGRNLELIPGERIVQSWRTTEFADEHEDSIVSVMLEEVDGGTLLTLMHTNVPDEQTSYERGGWQQYYFEPMREYFSKTGQDGNGQSKGAEVQDEWHGGEAQSECCQEGGGPEKGVGCRRVQITNHASNQRQAEPESVNPRRTA